MVSGISNQISQMSALSLSKTNDGDADDVPSANKASSTASNIISRNQIQDPSTVTAEQLQSPIDLRV